MYRDIYEIHMGTEMGHTYD